MGIDLPTHQRPYHLIGPLNTLNTKKMETTFKEMKLTGMSLFIMRRLAENRSICRSELTISGSELTIPEAWELEKKELTEKRKLARIELIDVEQAEIRLTKEWTQAEKKWTQGKKDLIGMEPAESELSLNKLIAEQEIGYIRRERTRLAKKECPQAEKKLAEIELSEKRKLAVIRLAILRLTEKKMRIEGEGKWREMTIAKSILEEKENELRRTK